MDEKQNRARFELPHSKRCSECLARSRGRHQKSTLLTVFHQAFQVPDEMCLHGIRLEGVLFWTEDPVFQGSRPLLPGQVIPDAILLPDGLPGKRVHVFPERVKLRQHLSGITPGPCCNQACVPFPAREQSRCGEIAGACDQAQFVIPEKQIALCMKPFDF